MSTLTVPLRLHDRVIGVLNVESVERDQFDDEDRIGAELLGRYVALSLNMLDMLVAERCETQGHAPLSRIMTTNSLLQS